MWNQFSFAKWLYHLPYVGMLHVFEMPLLGFAGYLPFGILCGMITDSWYQAWGAPSEAAGSAGEPAQGGKAPCHIAIIMDGNGRWARQRGLPRSAGHRRGLERVEQIIRESASAGIKYLTLFAFSTENWRRPAAEVEHLMQLFLWYLREKTAVLVGDGIRLVVVGDRSRLASSLTAAVAESEAATRNGDRMTLILAISYGSRDELCRAMTRLLEEKAAPPVHEDDIRRHLFYPEAPDPDLLIRTSGEQRLSNFLLWQAAYSELVFTRLHWPDFDGEELQRCIEEYRRRTRRYGSLEAAAPV
jgi:undecaprenyl diphosphate synthase